MSEIKKILVDLQKTAKDLKSYIKDNKLEELSGIAKNVVVTSAKEIDQIIEKNGLKEVKSRLNKDKKQLELLVSKIVQQESKKLQALVKTTNKEFDKVQAKVEQLADKLVSKTEGKPKKQTQKSNGETTDSSR